MAELRKTLPPDLFPARAGVIPKSKQNDMIVRAFPRTRGGDPNFFRDENFANPFSPHARG